MYSEKPNLLDEVRNVIRVKHYSIRTEEAYVNWVKRFVLFHGKRHPKYMGNKETRAFLTYLAVEQKVAASTQNQALNAIVFLYKEVLKQEVGTLDVSWVKRPERLPVVLTRAEVRQVLTQLQGTNWLMASLLYGSGLRLLECLRLRVKDIDFGYGQILVRDAKGNKDRVIMLPQTLKDPLQVHLQEVKALHDKDLQAGFGSVYMPYALERKYPNAKREFGWQYMFPASRLSVDPRSGRPNRYDPRVIKRRKKPKYNYLFQPRSLYRQRLGL